MTIQPEFCALVLFKTIPATTPSPRMTRIIVPTNSAVNAVIRPLRIVYFHARKFPRSIVREAWNCAGKMEEVEGPFIGARLGLKDRPYSSSGRLRTFVRRHAGGRGGLWFQHLHRGIRRGRQRL